MKKMIKKGFYIIFLLSVFLLMLGGNAFAADADGEDPVYKNFVILGDSICLGFSTESASMADSTTYDIEKNILRAALSEDYKHCYPTQFADRIGLTPFKEINYPNEMWNYLDEENWDDVYNFGICAAWSGDIKELLTNPYYLYQYASANYDKDSVFVLPEDYTGMRFPVNQDAEGHNDADMSTWEYTGDFSTTEEYFLPKGTSIPVAIEYEYFGVSYMMANPIITEKYYYVSEKCLDQNGEFINNKPIYYPTVLMSTDFGDMYVPDTETYGKELGNPIQNPEFTKYYYDIATTTVKNGDLIALAMGNNDIYHSFMPYQQSSDSLLCDLIYWISYALQMDYSVGDIMSMFNDPQMQSFIFGSLMSSSEVVPSENETPINPDSNSSLDLSGLISAEEIAALLELYSSENVTAYLSDTVEDYKVNYELTIQRILELKQDRSELVLVGHYNPFGMINYLTMLSEAAQNGQLYNHLSEDTEILAILLQSIIGTPEQWEEINAMDEDELEEYIETANDQMGSFLSLLEGIDLSDPEVDEALTQMLTDLSFPLSVLLVGSALSDTYSNMNDFLQEMAEKYDLVYVDVSDAPCSGRYDPHPTANGHKWISDRLYDTVVPSITATISPASTGKGVLTPLGKMEFRLRDNQTYRFLAADGSKISAIFIDGNLLSKDEFPFVYANGSYTFEKILKCHNITIQFDKDTDNSRKYAVNVLGSYAKYGAGEGMYKPGETVMINAGSLEGYEFTGWRADGVELTNTNNIITSFEMPANEVTVTATWRVIDDVSQHDCPSAHLKDVDITQWYHEYVDYVVSYRLMRGVASDLFAPNATTTRAMIITILYRLEGEPEVFGESPYDDVAEGLWYSDAIKWADANGIAYGYSRQIFGPADNITREQMAAFMYRYAKYKGYDVSKSADLNIFKDCDTVSAYALRDMEWAVAEELFNGVGSDLLSPRSYATRAQVATIIMRFIENLK